MKRDKVVLVNSTGRPPAWIQWFVNDAARAFHETDADCARNPLGCHYHFDEVAGVWEVSIFRSTTEIVGGPQDGQTIHSLIQVNLAALIELFDTLPEIHWQSSAVCPDDELGNHISAEGLVQGRQVWLRVLATPPEWIEPGKRLHVHTGRTEDSW